MECTTLPSLSPTQLLGALLSLKEQAKDATTLQQWEQLATTTTSHPESKVVPLSLSFQTPLSKEKAATLKAKGFRLNPLTYQWEVQGNPFTIQEELKKLQPVMELIKP